MCLWPKNKIRFCKDACCFSFVQKGPVIIDYNYRVRVGFRDCGLLPGKMIDSCHFEFFQLQHFLVVCLVGWFYPVILLLLVRS